MKAFKKHTILCFLILMTFHSTMAQSFYITGQTCVLPNTRYTYTLWGTFTPNITLYAYAVGGSVVGWTPNTVTVIWQGYGDYAPAYLYLNGVNYYVNAALYSANTIGLTSFTISNNKISSLKASYAAELGTTCSWSYQWLDVGELPNSLGIPVGSGKDLDLSNLDTNSISLRRLVRSPDNSSTWYSNVLCIKSKGITVGEDAGTLAPSPSSLEYATGYQWFESVDGINWTYISRAGYQTYNPGVLNATRFYKEEIYCNGIPNTNSTITNVTIFKVIVDQPLSAGVIAAPAPVEAGQIPGTIIIQQPASGGGCSTPAYQWEKSLDGINFTPITNATAEIYSPDYIYGSTWFRRKVTCGKNSLYSNVIECKPIKTLSGGFINPASAYIPNNGNLNFSSVFAATGGNAVDPIVYQWQQSADGINFTDIDGVISADYTPIGIDKTTYFRRKATCSNEIAYSNTAKAIKQADDAYNYVQELVAVKPGMPDNLEDYAGDLQQVQQTTTYFDGLGRTFQTVARNQSLVSGSAPTDLVQFNQYDAMGREVYGYLPFASPSSNGIIKSPAMVEQKAFYNKQLAAEPDEVNIGPSADNWAFYKTNYESSPLGRVTETFAPGLNWVGTNAQSQEDNRKSVKTKYLTNPSGDAVRVWKVTNVTGDWGTYQTTGTYEPGTLIKTITTNEQGTQTISFTDQDGQLILKKTQNTAAKDDGSGSGHAGWLCTYYVYDNLQQLRAVIQPNAIKTMTDPNNWTLDQTMLDELCFRYEYDDHGRVYRRKSPGSGEEAIVYDALDRPILSQHANQRAQHQWIYSKYDVQGRLVITGKYSDNTHTTTADMQAYVDGQNYALYELPTSNFPFYTNSRAFPNLSNDIISIDYYDNYNFTSFFAAAFQAKDNSFDNYFSTNNSTYPYPTSLAQGSVTNGKVTGHWESTGSGTLRVIFYDDNGQPIQVRNQNNLGGTDIRTIQYGYMGMPLIDHFQSEKKGTNPQTVTTLSLYSYDNLGRITSVAKKTGSTLIQNGTLPNDYTVISETKYDALGQISAKKIGRQKDAASGKYTSQEMEAQTFDYNIRGWLLGMNRNYLSGNTGDHFGFELAYDKQASKINNNTGSIYANRLLNGNINGMMWRSTGDGEIRKYDYSYDVAGRLTAADFNQYTNNQFDKSAKVDFTVSNLQYDNNGNIQSMKQMGLKGPESDVVDDLAYTYFSGGNRLKNVRDANNNSASTMGDFKTSLAHPQSTTKQAANTQALRDQITDYEYDINGNLVKDYNKDIGDATTQGITYNYLDLPELITFKKAGAATPSTIAFTYDAVGNKIRKVVTDNYGPSPVTTTTEYGQGMVYVNDVLQFVGHEEGRTRFKPAMGTADAQFNYDYFLKDHLGNIRMVLTEEQEHCIYPAATLEGNGTTASVPNALFKEKEFYDINEGNIVDVPDNTVINYPNNNGIYNNNLYSDQGATTQKMYQLMASPSSGKAATGLGIVLKVMSGDKIDILGKSYYNIDNSITHQNYALPVESLLAGFLGGSSGLGAAKGVTSGTLSNMPAIAGDVGTFLNDPRRGNNSDDRPKAYINYILLDNQFHFVSGGFSRVGTLGEVKDHFTIDPQTLHNIPVTKNGYLYVYCSNESPVNVYFDNLQVVHSKGALLEETHHYPFGLAMAGISDKASKFDYFENNYKFNGGSELQHHEFTDGSGLELYSTDFRSYDPQLGRFHQIDPLAGYTFESSPYAFANNNPLNFGDPSGLSADTAVPGVPLMPEVVVIGYKGQKTEEVVPEEEDAAVPVPAAPAKTPAPVAKPAPATKPAPSAKSTAKPVAAVKPAAKPTAKVKRVPSKPTSLPTPASNNEGDIADTYPGNDWRSYLKDPNNPKPYEVDCSMFGYEVALRAGYNIQRGTAVDQANWYKNHGHWSDKLADALKGDHIFWSRGTGKYHTGVISDVRLVGKNRIITVVQSQTFGHEAGSIQRQTVMSNGQINGFWQPFVGVGRYP